jgi:hypothetical protein
VKCEINNVSIFTVFFTEPIHQWLELEPVAARGSSASILIALALARARARARGHARGHARNALLAPGLLPSLALVIGSMPSRLVAVLQSRVPYSYVNVGKIHHTLLIHCQGAKDVDASSSSSFSSRARCSAHENGR